MAIDQYVIDDTTSRRANGQLVPEGKPIEFGEQEELEKPEQASNITPGTVQQGTAGAGTGLITGINQFPFTLGERLVEYFSNCLLKGGSIKRNLLNDGSWNEIVKAYGPTMISFTPSRNESWRLIFTPTIQKEVSTGLLREMLSRSYGADYSLLAGSDIGGILGLNQGPEKMLSLSDENLRAILPELSVLESLEGREIHAYCREHLMLMMAPVETREFLSACIDYEIQNRVNAYRNLPKDETFSIRSEEARVALTTPKTMLAVMKIADPNNTSPQMMPYLKAVSDIRMQIESLKT